MSFKKSGCSQVHPAKVANISLRYFVLWATRKLKKSDNFWRFENGNLSLYSDPFFCSSKYEVFQIDIL
jgi:hypothetical protein